MMDWGESGGPRLEGMEHSRCHQARMHERSQSTLVYGGQVATRRTRTAGKVEIPNVDDHVSKLEHMGKETVKKLQDIRGSAVQCGIDVNVPDNCIVKGAHAGLVRTRVWYSCLHPLCCYV